MTTGCQFVPCPWPHLAPGATIYPRLLGSITIPALFVDVERDHADAVTIEIRIRDLSRQQESLGTEVPTIREEDAFAGPLQIVDVRRGGPFRGMLRIYEFDPSRSARVLVRFFGLNYDQWDPLTAAPDVAITERVIELPRQPAVHGSYPLYAQLPLESIPEFESFERIRIEIEPLTEGMRFWAMVSITNNATQQVTLVTPK